MRVVKCAEVVRGEIVALARPGLPVRPGDLAAVLTNLEPTIDPTPGPEWTMRLTIGEGEKTRVLNIDIVRFLSEIEFETSFREPYAINSNNKTAGGTRFFLFRNSFFLTEYAVFSGPEYEEAVLRIKKIAYDAEAEIRALRAAVANLEAAVEYQRTGPRRESLPDDVKLVVWSRDGGACVRCGSKEKLHFDHVIPVAKGGGNDADNIQILCQSCNLRKSDRITF